MFLNPTYFTMNNETPSNMYRKSASVQSPQSETVSNVLKAMSFDNEEQLQCRSERSASIKVVEDLVQCGICMDKFLEPRMLPCQHTFCMDCLSGHLFATVRKMMGGKPSDEEVENNISGREQEFKCSLCQIDVKIEKDGLKELPRNLYIDSLLQFLENAGKSNGISTGMEIKCAYCQKVGGVEGKNCKHCKQVFCATCWPDHVSKLKSVFVNLTEQLKESEMRLKYLLGDFHDRCDKMEKTIKRTAMENVSKINSMEQSGIKKLEDIKNYEISIAEVITKSIIDLRMEIEQFGFDSISNYEDKVDSVISFNRKTQKILDDASQWGETRLIFDVKAFKLNYSSEFMTRNRNSVEERNKIVKLTVLTNPLENIESTAQHYRKKSKKPKLIWTKCPRPAGVGIPPWAPHLLYIAATDRKVVLIMDRYVSKVIGKLSAPSMMLCPYGLAFCKKRSEIFVSDKWKHCIHVFSCDGNYDRTLSPMGVRSPEGIAVSQRGDLIVCDTGNDRVLVLDPIDGRQISVLGMEKNCTDFSIPTGVTTYNKDKIIVADNGNHKIKIFSINGQKLEEFGTMGTNNGQFASMEAVTCDPMGFILIGDAGNARIQIFDPNMKLVRIIGGYGETPGKFAWISGLVVTPQMEIIATDYKNRRLQIF